MFVFIIAHRTHLSIHFVQKKDPKLALWIFFDSHGIILAFLISVLASVAGYYICKWLDGDE